MTTLPDWPDDVKRVKDAMDLHAVAGAHGFAVIALADGRPMDNNAYPTWKEAVMAARWNRDRYIFLEIQPGGMGYAEARAVLDYARKLHDGGYRIPDPDWEAGPMASSMPRTRHDQDRMIRQLVSGKPLLPADVPYGNVPAAFRRKAING